MGTGVQCVLQRMHNMTAESASGALHSEREMCYNIHRRFFADRRCLGHRSIVVSFIFARVCYLIFFVGQYSSEMCDAVFVFVFISYYSWL